MGSLIIRWLLNALGLFIVAQFVSGVGYSSLQALLIAALVLGLLNAIVKPILFWLTLPLTIVTLGLFLIVLNAIIVMLTAYLVPGFTVTGFVPAAIAGLILGLISLVTSRIGKNEK